jgi:hypothetical protein
MFVSPVGHAGKARISAFGKSLPLLLRDSCETAGVARIIAICPRSVCALADQADLRHAAVQRLRSAPPGRAVNSDNSDESANNKPPISVPSRQGQFRTTRVAGVPRPAQPTRKITMRVRYVMLFFIAMVSGAEVLAQEWAGTVKAVSGSTMVERGGTRLPLTLGSKVFPGDTLVTGPDSRVALTLRDDTLISTGANSQLALRGFAFNATTQEGSLFISVLRGVSAMVSGLLAKANPNAMHVDTPNATIGIRGTEFIVEVNGDE